MLGRYKRRPVTFCTTDEYIVASSQDPTVGLVSRALRHLHNKAVDERLRLRDRRRIGRQAARELAVVRQEEELRDQVGVVHGEALDLRARVKEVDRLREAGQVRVDERVLAEYCKLRLPDESIEAEA